MSVQFRQRTPGEYLKILKRRKWLIILPVIAVASAVAWVVYRLPDVYESSTLVVVKPSTLPNSVVPTVTEDSLTRQLSSIAQVVTSRSSLHPKLLTAEYKIAKRPRGRVLVDYNQNAWGRTLASIYSPRPKPRASVSTPVTWDEVERGFAIADFRIDNVPARVARLGDLWAPLLARRGRFRLERML